ncbi:hypothetical protein [Thiocapsa bogorovii]|uniref:hypothetical protein n=1 Tax=Thiocapsa bogorovii TaxID=521689 RepID=UPI001E4FD4E0|nr:hypothetical protein [Thiocapsa bogorovii]UHD14510.1 hypothetical protein LT988_14500 [Thiocapsa bogorovii]
MTDIDDNDLFFIDGTSGFNSKTCLLWGINHQTAIARPPLGGKQVALCVNPNRGRCRSQSAQLKPPAHCSPDPTAIAWPFPLNGGRLRP